MIQTSIIQGNEQLLYRAITCTVGGRRQGKCWSADGNLEVRFAFPGDVASGTNPEQLLAAGWSACFESAISLVATGRDVPMPDHLFIDAVVDLNLGAEGYFLRGTLTVDLPGMEHETACNLIEEAYRVCPFSKAMRGNVDMNINLRLAGGRRICADREDGISERAILLAE